jgi:uncharacterized YceG family protein
MADRTPEERERDRLEREARRAKKQGKTPPPPPPPPAAAPQPAPPAQPPAEPPNVQNPTAGGGETDVRPVEPPATGRDWRREAGDPDPDPPLVRRVEGGRDRPEEVHASEEPLPEPTRPEPPGRRIPPPPPVDGGGSERALGTKRVTAARRPHLPRRDGGSPGGPGSHWPRRIGALAALAVVAFVLWFAASLFQPFAGDGGAAKTVTIPQGSSVADVGDILAEEGVVSSAWFFKLRAKLEGKDQLRSGKVAMKEDMSYGAALDALEATTENAAPAPKLTKVSIPEGLSREEIAARVEDAGVKGDYLKASRSVKGFNPRRYKAPAGAPLEGFLFPATYDIKKNQDAGDLVRQQLSAFEQNFASVDLRKAKKKNLTPYDILIIASMIDREVQIAKERPLVAAVIYNRLKDGMPLGIDATLRYELKNWTDPLKVSELEADTPYNTRVNTGLTPTPIGNPGLASIEAAANPAKVDYLFYVVKPCGDGAHNFSSTDAEFQQDVDAYNRKRDELGGKSPVTC